MTDVVSLNPEQQQAAAIFRYLRDLVRLKTIDIRNLDRYERVFWLEAVRGKPGCVAKCFRPDAGGQQANREPTETEAWLTVRKWPEPIVAAPPAGIRAWIAPDSGQSP